MTLEGSFCHEIEKKITGNFAGRNDGIDGNSRFNPQLYNHLCTGRMIRTMMTGCTQSAAGSMTRMATKSG